jgi:heme-degrading monooxygenase HmoA
MLVNASQNKEINGFLGKTSKLMSSDEDCNNSVSWVTYWKDLASLQAFANGPLHSKGVQWYVKEVSKKYPHIGIFHEVYTVPKGHWETISVNMKPFGMGNAYISSRLDRKTDMLVATTTHFVRENDTKSYRETGALVKADESQRWQTMAGRMGRNMEV